MQWDIGLEIGQTGVRLATREKGVSLLSPAWGATRGEQILAVGDEAQAMLGRTIPGVELSRPVYSGALYDVRLAGQWIARLIGPFVSRTVHPRVVLADSGFFPHSELELLTGAVISAGAESCGLIHTDLISALGAGVDVLSPAGTLCLRLGAGTLSASIISFGRIVRAERRAVGAEQIDLDIIRLVREKLGLSVGFAQAEDLKRTLASALYAREIDSEAAGLDLVTGFPGTRTVTAAQVKEAVDPVADSLCGAAQNILGQAPDELCADLLVNGAVLTGGGALISGLDQLLAQKLSLPCRAAKNPLLSSALGMEKLLRSEELSELVEEARAAL